MNARPARILLADAAEVEPLLARPLTAGRQDPAAA